jgi:hypothetical protein
MVPSLKKIHSPAIDEHEGILSLNPHEKELHLDEELISCNLSCSYMLAIEMLAMRNAFSTLKLVIGFCGSKFSMGRYLAQSWWIYHCVPWVELNTKKKKKKCTHELETSFQIK